MELPVCIAQTLSSVPAPQSQSEEQASAPQCRYVQPVSWENKFSHFTAHCIE